MRNGCPSLPAGWWVVTDDERAVIEAAKALRRYFPSHGVGTVMLDPMPCIDLARAVDALPADDDLPVCPFCGEVRDCTGEQNNE